MPILFYALEAPKPLAWTLAAVAAVAAVAAANQGDDVKLLVEGTC